ncbi:MAG: metal ABC transporter substrate-binding protein, partial [Lachnospiraceae bacterium]|nr:metal ABC transporter substrate-binding protein [Lachnospiraceae bacterium]
FLEKNKEAVDKLVAGYEEAGNRLDETTAKTLAETYLGQNEKTLEVSMQWIHYDNLEITKSDYEQLTERMQKYGINKNPPSYEEFVYQNQDSASD